MRFKFFIYIGFTLTSMATVIVLLHIYFFSYEPLKIIDAQLIESAQLLDDPKLLEELQGHNQNIENLISNKIGDGRIGKFFIFLDPDNKSIYKSLDVPISHKDFDRNSEWIELSNEKQYIKLLNYKLKAGAGWTLQVGTALEPSLLDWNTFNLRASLFALGIVLLTTFFSFFLSRALLAPLRLLSRHINEATMDLKNLKNIPNIPQIALDESKLLWSKNDDFSLLSSSMQRLIERVNANYQLTKAWTFQMAHELKTPLAILNAEIEYLAKTKPLSSSETESISGEIKRISDTISHFLDWADLENSKSEGEVDALPMAKCLMEATARLDRLFPNRLNLFIEGDSVVLVNRSHLEQVLNNLLSNSLKYTESNKSVDVFLYSDTLQVVDRGQGIPKEVLVRLGEPFNFGANAQKNSIKGHGLGLAWVQSVSRIYGWHVKYDVSEKGTSVQVHFPSVAS